MRVLLQLFAADFILELDPDVEGSVPALVCPLLEAFDISSDNQSYQACTELHVPQNRTPGQKAYLRLLASYVAVNVKKHSAFCGGGA